MDEFELAGFDEETCEQLRKISEESGVAPCHIISAIRGCQPDTEMVQFASAWYRFRKALWDEFKKSKIGKFMFWLADKLSAFLERKMKMIELHWNGNPYSLNVAYIVAVCKKGGDSETESEIFTVGDKVNDSWNAEESYEEVLRMIREVSEK